MPNRGRKRSVTPSKDTSQPDKKKVDNRVSEDDKTDVKIYRDKEIEDLNKQILSQKKEIEYLNVKLTKYNELEEENKKLLKELKLKKDIKNETLLQQITYYIKLIENLIKIKCDYDKENNKYNCHFTDDEKSAFSLKFENDKFTFTPSDYLCQKIPEDIRQELTDEIESAQIFLVILIQGYYKVGEFQRNNDDSSSQ